jgi:predicted esterase
MPLQSIIEPPNEADPPEAGWPLIIFLHGTTGSSNPLLQPLERLNMALDA